ncbi:MAG: single-stranded DNA-binding protein [Lachnospiraceae bacterium]|nr:single-stranded DNA-binding protein [Lachnospiraceae bacterium]
MENSFKISGYVGFADVKQFETSSVCRFSISVGRKEKGKDDYTSAFLNMEAWRKNDSKTDFSAIEKGNLIQVEGFFKPEEWEDKDGKKQNRVVLVATKYEHIQK